MRKKLLVCVLAAVMAVSFAGCGSKSQTGSTGSAEGTTKAAESTTAAAEGTTQAAETTTAAENTTEAEKDGIAGSGKDKVKIHEASKVDQMADPEKGETIAIMKVKDYGEIKIKFFNQDSPKAVENFLTLASQGYYDGITFHRVIDGFMIQGGDPTGSGGGGQSMWGEEFKNEYSDTLLPVRGALCMANAGVDTNGSQFFIEQQKDAGEGFKELAEQNGVTLSDKQVKAFEEYGGSPWLTGGYTIFGQVYEGMDIVDQIAATETDGNDKPATDVVMESIQVTRYK